MLYFLQRNTLKIADKNLFSKLLILETPQNLKFYIVICNPTLKLKWRQLKITWFLFRYGCLKCRGTLGTKHFQARTNKQKTKLSHNDQNIIMLLKYTKQGSFNGLKQKPGLSLIITRHSENLLKATERAKTGLQVRLRIACQIYSQWSW